MLKSLFIALLAIFLPFSNGTFNLVNGFSNNKPKTNTGTLEKMIVAEGSVRMDVDFSRLNATQKRSRDFGSGIISFDVEKNSFFSIIVFNDELRGPLPSSMAIIPQNFPNLPAKLQTSFRQLVIESVPFGEQYDLVVRDGRTGFIFFNIEGHQYDFDSDRNLFGVRDGRVLVSKEFAAALGNSSQAGAVVGRMSISAKMRSIETSEVVDGEVVSETMPAISPEDGNIPGPDVVVGDVYGLAQFGSNGSQVGLAVGTVSCNFGTENLNWFANPNNDHPVIPQNLYRMSGGTDNTERFEQIGQSSVKHAFTALTQNLCGLGCNGVGGSRLGSGCSDPYSAGLNAGPNLGSRAWINPFTGFFPRNDSGTPNNSHTGHSHNGTTHRILTEMNDLNTMMNAGATYYAEGQYITPHEYAWCQSNPGQCNMYNNVSYRQYSVSGTNSFSFSPVGATVRQKAAIEAWTGATTVRFEPDPGNDGVGIVGYKVTNPSPGVWHYEYNVYNQNLDRGVQSFSVPLGNGITLSNIGFHAPPQHPGSANDGTFGNAGFSSAPWAETQTSGAMTWSSETFAQNQNANAIRWGTMYSFRFDSNRPPQTVNATLGFFKTGSPITVQVQAPSPTVTNNVSVSGRVFTQSGNPVRLAYVTITDSNNVSRTDVTGTFGHYRFENVVPGGTYTISVQSGRYTYAPQVVQINDNVSGLDFIAQ